MDKPTEIEIQIGFDKEVKIHTEMEIATRIEAGASNAGYQILDTGT